MHIEENILKNIENDHREFARKYLIPHLSKDQLHMIWEEYQIEINHKKGEEGSLYDALKYCVLCSPFSGH